MSIFSDIGESLGNAVMENVGRAVSQAQERSPLPVDLLESEDAYLAVFDAPGATPSDVQVQYSHNAVEVRIDRFRQFHEGFEMRFPGRGLSLDGRVELPADAHVDPEAATATLRDDGTLAVTIPKREDHEGDGDDGEGEEWETKDPDAEHGDESGGDGGDAAEEGHDAEGDEHEGHDHDGEGHDHDHDGHDHETDEE